MYQVEYTKLAIGKDGEVGNISQGKGIAYMDCLIDQIQSRLEADIEKDKKWPCVDKVTRIKGHIVR